MLAEIAELVGEVAVCYFRAVGSLLALTAALVFLGALIDAAVYNGRRAGGIWSVPFWYQWGAGWWRLEIQAPGRAFRPVEDE